MDELRLRLSDLVGVVLFGALAGWLFVSSALTRADAVRWIGLVAAVGVAATAARVISVLHGWIVPATVAVIAAAWGWLRFDVLLANLDSPLGYANATAAFYVVAAGASLMVVVRARPPAVRFLAAAAAVTFAAVPWANGSLAGAIATMLLPLALLGTLGRRARWFLCIGGAVAVLTTFLVTVVLANGGGSGAGGIGGALTARRLRLWNDALRMIGEEPWTGFGPGRFELFSPTALSDQDAIWAHSEYLEVGAASGVIGLILMLGIVVWAFQWLWSGTGRLGASVAAVVLAGVGSHAAIDYIFHFAAVPVALAAVVGAGATAGARSRSRRRTVTALSPTPDAPVQDAGDLPASPLRRATSS